MACTCSSLALGLNFLPQFSVSLVLYLETTLLYQVLELTVPCVNSQTGPVLSNF